MTSQTPLSGRVPLKQRFLKGGAWSVAGIGMSQVIRFGANLVLTRLLVPEMFALMSIATIVMVGLTLFSDVGVRPNIVRSKRGADPVFLNTAWSLQIVRGVILLVAALGASFLPQLAVYMGVVPSASVYADPRLPYVIAAISLSVLISGFASTKVHEAYRKLTIGRVAQLEVISQVAGLLLTFGWIVFDRSISALIAGTLCGSLTRMVLSHVWLTGHSNRWQWEKSAFWEIFHFGKWIIVSSLLAFFANSGDRMILAGLVDKTLLGVYVIAFSAVNIIDLTLRGLISGVMFPALSEVIRERPQNLRATYYKMHIVAAAVAYFCAGTLMLSGQSLIHVLYDPRYAEAGWMLEILAITLLAVPFQITIQSFLALGNPKIQSFMVVVRLVALFVGMPLGFSLFGLSGALWGNVCSQFLPLPITIFYSARYEIFDLRRELLMLPMVFVGMGAGWLIDFAIRSVWGVG
jgi:O-antigen/teichoic acid export membrane protein